MGGERGLFEGNKNNKRRKEEVKMWNRIKTRPSSKPRPFVILFRDKLVHGSAVLINKICNR